VGLLASLEHMLSIIRFSPLVTTSEQFIPVRRLVTFCLRFVMAVLSDG